MESWVVLAPPILLVFSLLVSSSMGDIESVISKSMFEDMLRHKDDGRCPEAKGFYTYEAFISAAKSFSGFGTTGDATTQKKEIAAFFGQTSHETTGGTAGAPDRYDWGYCFKEQRDHPPGERYYGRGPIQLTHDYNYRQCGDAIRVDLLSNPDLITTDAVISFKSAIWFWMTPQGSKPSCHDVITGKWQPSPDDKAAGRVPGYGVITNIINGGVECGQGPTDSGKDRIGYYNRYSGMFGVVDSTNLDCYNQKPFV